MSKIAIAILILFTSSTSANERMSLDAFCKSNPCRRDITIRLMQKDGNDYEQTFKLLPPAVQPSFLSIYAGETIYIEAEEGVGAPINLVQVEINRNPNKTMVFKLEQPRDIGDGKSMLLTVENPFSRSIRYSMGMMPLDRKTLLKTSSCPVIAKGNAFESWPFPIFQLVIANIHFQTEDDDGSCR